MTIDITGISNENEFYTHHYLAAILENDLKSIFQEWKRREEEEGTTQPFARLRSLRKDFFAMRSSLERERNMAERLLLQRRFVIEFLQVLGYELHPFCVETDEGTLLPLLGGINRADGSPELWILEAVELLGEDFDPLTLTPIDDQYPEDTEPKQRLNTPFEEIISKQVFSRSEPPRWIILISSSQLLLLDRSKWHEKRLLRFDIHEILDRRETSTLQATAALLHRESTCPGEGTPLLDTLDENSHKHAFAVSEDLKYSLREAIELLGNEAVYYLREVRKEKIYGRDMAGQLTRECLRYMYRLLFLFYIEARPELGYLPTESEQYRKGYSLESLRDLEMISLTTEESKNGTYLHQSISTLFDLLYNGFQESQLDMFGNSLHNTFEMAPLRSHLFDPVETALLNKVKFRNFILQAVIELMSLSRSQSGRNTRRGRISYSQLGINQLGAVYEALLSYQGFFAETDLYEVKRAQDAHNVLETAYFVKPDDLEQYTEEERVYKADGTLMKYERGTFIYRLAGRDREKSASYYTPEVLTQCLVKYALKELLKEKTADEILHLTVCEPAMGSAAFLNEAVNQLARAYLDLKQKETDITLSHEEYPQELQKVKMYIADNNVYGVDLNPTAVELAEVSLWLNTIYKGAFVPWFGTQLVCGNSLIGARRQVFASSQLRTKNRGDTLWLDSVPERVMPGAQRQPETIYHFLLPDKGMANYTDKVVKSLAGEQIGAINAWRKEFIQSFSVAEIGQLEQLSVAVDKLWRRHIEMQQDINRRTTDPLRVFGQPEVENTFTATTTEAKDRIYRQEMLAREIRNSSPYRRLKLVMDYWCALWFWPIEQANLLPGRAQYLFDLTLLLEGNLFEAEQAGPGGQMQMFPDTRPQQMSIDMVDEFGYVNVDKLCRENPRLELVQQLANRYRFHHWELHFASVFATRGGFDLILGNPPWIKVEWNEGGLLGDYEPLFILRNYSASSLTAKREETLAKYTIWPEYLGEYAQFAGSQNFLNGLQNYPLLKGMQANLYKCFLPLAWHVCNNDGVAGFVHPEGVYDDPKGGLLRAQMYKRLVCHFQFQNGLNLFADVAHREKYSVNIYNNAFSERFFSLCNLFHPVTVCQSFQHSGQGACAGIKNDSNEWNLTGHKDRIIEVDQLVLKSFATLYDELGTPALEARLPVIHSQQVLAVLQKFAAHPRKLSDIGDSYSSTEMWHETNAQKDGTIRRETKFPSSVEGLVLSGPHFYVGKPFNKTPRTICNEKSDYDTLDLTTLPADYLPRTNYVPACDWVQYVTRTPHVPWDNGLPNKVTGYYRLITRKMLPPPNERTLAASIIPKNIAHNHGCFSITFLREFDLLNSSASFCSLVFDFFVKVMGKTNFTDDIVRKLPYIQFNNHAARLRILILTAVTTHYADLWQECWDDAFRQERWAKDDPRLDNARFTKLTQSWQRDCALRTDYERRQALVEIDVLTAMALKLTLDELCIIYRIQFPVLRQNENDTWYDRNGRIVFTCSKGLPGVGFSRAEWNEIKAMASGTVSRTIVDDTLPGGPVERTITYHAPFDRCDREKDYEVVWAEFERRFAQ